MWAFALIAGLVLASVLSATMVPLSFPTPREKRTAIIAAFLDRFFLRFVVGPAAAGLDTNGVLIGAILGLGSSIPTALITRGYVPVIVLGLAGGTVVGLAYELLL